MRNYDLIDLELVKDAPRGWSIIDADTWKNVDFWLRRTKSLRGPYNTALHNMVRTAISVYKMAGLECPWGGTDNERVGKYATAIGVGIIYPAAEPAASAPVEPPVLKETCRKCGYTPPEAVPDSPPTPEIEDRIDRELIVSQRREARWIVDVLREAPHHVAAAKDIAQALKQRYDVDAQRCRNCLSALARAGILDRPETGIYRLPEGA